MAGEAPAALALTVTVYVPFGVPGFVLLLLLLPPQDASHSVENPRATIRPRKRMLRSERRRDPPINIMPSSPGSSAA